MLPTLPLEPKGHIQKHTLHFIVMSNFHLHGPHTFQITGHLFQDIPQFRFVWGFPRMSFEVCIPCRKSTEVTRCSPFCILSGDTGLCLSINHEFTLITWLRWCLPGFSSVKWLFLSLQLINIWWKKIWQYANISSASNFHPYIQFPLMLLGWIN